MPFRLLSCVKYNEAEKENAHRDCRLHYAARKTSGIDVANGSLNAGRLQESSEESTSKAEAEHGLEETSFG